MNIVMARAYCHKIIKLSPVIQSLAPEKEIVCNVHGVRNRFLEVGDEYRDKVRLLLSQGVCGRSRRVASQPGASAACTFPSSTRVCW